MVVTIEETVFTKGTDELVEIKLLAYKRLLNDLIDFESASGESTIYAQRKVKESLEMAYRIEKAWDLFDTP